MTNKEYEEAIMPKLRKANTFYRYSEKQHILAIFEDGDILLVAFKEWWPSKQKWNYQIMPAWLIGYNFKWGSMTWNKPKED